jgi:hypothetical protein
MTAIEIHAVNAARGARLDGERAATAAAGLAKFLCLAATPTFALMGLLTGLFGSPMDGLCSPEHGALLSGMVPMYLFMSAFHSPPWLNLIFGRRGGSPGSDRAATAVQIPASRARPLTSRDDLRTVGR